MPWFSPPSSSTRWSWTILTTCWPGVTDLSTASPIASARTPAMKSRATLKLTSASSIASRTSRKPASTSASVSTPLESRPLKAASSRRVRSSNTSGQLLDSLLEVRKLPLEFRQARGDLVAFSFPLLGRRDQAQFGLVIPKNGLGAVHQVVYRGAAHSLDVRDLRV